LLFSLGIVLGLTWIAFADEANPQVGRPETSVQHPDPTSAVLVALIGGLSGARLLFVVLHLSYFQDHPSEIIALWQGGLSASGGILGALLAIWGYTWKDTAYRWRLLDRLAIPALILAITSWVGCWLDGVAYGKPVDLSLGILMNSDPFEAQTARWPTQFAGVLLSLLGFLSLFHFSPRLTEGLTATLAMSAISVTLVVVGLFRGDPGYAIRTIRLDLLGPVVLTALGLTTTMIHSLRVSNSRS
jgi:phosphatidylglycerol:prolipoprotein diacylglycerol transferase